MNNRRQQRAGKPWPKGCEPGYRDERVLHNDVDYTDLHSIHEFLWENYRDRRGVLKLNARAIAAERKFVPRIVGRTRTMLVEQGRATRRVVRGRQVYRLEDPRKFTSTKLEEYESYHAPHYPYDY